MTHIERGALDISVKSPITVTPMSDPWFRPEGDGLRLPVGDVMSKSLLVLGRRG